MGRTPKATIMSLDFTLNVMGTHWRVLSRGKTFVVYILKRLHWFCLERKGSNGGSCARREDLEVQESVLYRAATQNPS